jgi:hypothetical protein
MQNLRKFRNGKFTDAQKQHGRGRGVHTSVAKETKVTSDLPSGTVCRFVEFAEVAAENDAPLNTLLTLRWHALRAEGASYRYLSLPVRERISKSVELLRKFTIRHSGKFPWIWVQENPRNAHGGLHWHIAFHSRSEWCMELINYVVRHFGLPQLPSWLVEKPTQGEIARSEARAWHLAIDKHPERQGRNLALYLGKGDRDVRQAMVGDFPKRQHLPQGLVEGTAKDRFSISRGTFCSNLSERLTERSVKIAKPTE